MSAYSFKVTIANAPLLEGLEDFFPKKKSTNLGEGQRNAASLHVAWLASSVPAGLHAARLVPASVAPVGSSWARGARGHAVALTSRQRTFSCRSAVHGLFVCSERAATSTPAAWPTSRAALDQAERTTPTHLPDSARSPLRPPLVHSCRQLLLDGGKGKARPHHVIVQVPVAAKAGQAVGHHLLACLGGDGFLYNHVVRARLAGTHALSRVPPRRPHRLTAGLPSPPPSQTCQPCKRVWQVKWLCNRSPHWWPEPRGIPNPSAGHPNPFAAPSAACNQPPHQLHQRPVPPCYHAHAR